MLIRFCECTFVIVYTQKVIFRRKTAILDQSLTVALRNTKEFSSKAPPGALLLLPGEVFGGDLGTGRVIFINSITLM